MNMTSTPAETQTSMASRSTENGSLSTDPDEKRTRCLSYSVSPVDDASVRKEVHLKIFRNDVSSGENVGETPTTLNPTIRETSFDPHHKVLEENITTKYHDVVQNTIQSLTTSSALSFKEITDYNEEETSFYIPNKFHTYASGVLEGVYNLK